MLLDETRALLAASDESREKIAVNAGVTYSWLCKFQNQEYGNPRINFVQSLYDYLKKQSKKKTKYKSEPLTKRTMSG